MQPLIKITTEPIQITRFTQNARLVSPNSVDIERRKAIARHRMMHKTGLQGSASIENLSRINRTFSQHMNTVSPQPQEGQSQSFEQLASQQSHVASVMKSAPKVQVSQNIPAPTANLSATDSASAATAANSVASAVTSSQVSQEAQAAQDLPAQAGLSYTAQRGAFEMRVAKGELTYLPPLTMTIVTQRPSVHVEYLGGYNYVPRRTDTSTNINLFT